MVPPHEGVPDDEAPCNVPEAPNSDVRSEPDGHNKSHRGVVRRRGLTCRGLSCSGFDFKRLGLRATAMVISPVRARPGAVKRPARFPMKIRFVWGFCMGVHGA